MSKLAANQTRTVAAHEASMHHATAAEFYRVRASAADSMDTVNSIDLIAT